MSRTQVAVVLVLLGVVRAALSEEVIDDIGISIPRLRITQQPIGGTVPRGERFAFTCIAETSTDKSLVYSWKRLTVNSLNPVFENLPTDETGQEGEYIVYTAETSAFYFCVVTSDTYQTSSDGAYLQVAYLDDMEADAGPVSTVYNDPVLYVELQCKVPNSNPYPKVQWFKQEVEFAAENAIMKRDENGNPSNLIVFDVTVDDSGLYHCEVENEGAGVKHVSEKGDIQIKPTAETRGKYDIWKVVGDYTVQEKEGTTITLYAGVASRPKAVYQWSLNNVEILSEGRYQKDDEGRSLVISDLTGADEGVYVVTYSQEGVIEGADNIDLEVIEKIKAEGDVYDYATVTGEDLNLDCGCVGSPPDWVQFAATTPATQWFFNGKLLQNSDNTEVMTNINGKNTGEALVRSVSDKESGTYSCSCFNQAEYLTFIKNVYVADERENITVSSQPEGWGLVGTTVSMSCTAEGTPRPEIEWYKGGSKVVEGVFPRDGFRVEFEREMFKTIGYLVVDEGKFTDTGVFECKAFHIVKGVEFSETSASTLIIDKPTSSRIKCLDTVVEEGKSATIICAVSGVPIPTVTYTKINEDDDSLIQLDPGHGTVNERGYYIIDKVRKSDAGVYRGWADNVASGGLLGRYDTMNLYVTPLSTRMSMNAIIGVAVLIAFLLIGGLIVAIFVGRWRRETAFKSEMKRLIKKRDEEVNELQQKLQLRSMEHVTPAIGNPLHQLPETRRQMPSFYAANIAVMAATPSAKFLPPSLADLKKRKILSGSVIHEQRTTVSPSSVKTVMSDVEDPDMGN